MSGPRRDATGPRPAQGRATASEPVTVLEGRTVAPEHHGDYRDWVYRLIAAGDRFPGNRGVTVLAAEAVRSDERYLILAFADQEAKLAWQRSEEWAVLRREAAAFSTPRVQTATGAGPWFTLPGQEVAAPPRWKMSLAIVPAAYVLSAVGILLVDALLPGWPFLLVNLAVTVFLGFSLTYVGLPWTTRLLRSWLYAPAATNRDAR